ncbi:MAG TPA: hypothetical protein VGG41_16075 [Solirubrobacteraceae bacterium]|jgi:hypothetical protein
MGQPAQRSCVLPVSGLIAIAASVVAIAILAAPLTPAAVADAGDSGATGAAQCPTSNPPNTLTLVSGSPQTAQLGASFASPIQVSLANTNGCPITTTVAGTAITFSAPGAGPSGVFSTSGSNTLTVGADTSGSAAASMFTANTTAGGYTVTASCAYGTVSFQLVNTAAGIPATVTALALTSQHESIGGRYPEPLSVRVLDASGNPVVGATVNFTLGSGSGAGSSSAASAAAGATFAGAGNQVAAQTDSDGIATSPSFNANTTVGPFTATASTAHVSEPAVFSLENRAAKLATVRRLGSAAMTATVKKRYRRPLRVEVRSPTGAPLSGVTVSFTLGSGAGAADSADATFADGSTQASAVTGVRGIATSPVLSANSTSGTVAATAVATAIPGAVRFTLRNRAGKPATITPGVAANESGRVDARFGVPLAVTVTDSHHNPVVGAKVTFTAPRSGPGGIFLSRSQRLSTVVVKTNSSGVAVAPAFTANGELGGYVVTASARGARSVAFALVNEAS